MAARTANRVLTTMVRIAKVALTILILAGLLLGCQQLRLSERLSLSSTKADTLRLATWNAHYIVRNQVEGRWGISGWEARKGPMDATFKALDVDILAFQEMETFAGGDADSVNLARSWLLKNNPGYAAAAIGDWRKFPSTQPIFYRRDRLEVVDQGWFFFSETPDVIYSRTFNGSYPAFASWARFQDRDSGAAFHVVNVHLDFRSTQNRRQSTELIVARITPWIAAGQTVFLAGDLNARLGSDLHEQLEASGLTFLPVSAATYHLDRGLNLFGAIDHIAYTGAATPAGPPIVYQQKLGEVWATDHYPLVSDFNLTPP